MESDDLKHQIPRKRSHSPTPSVAATLDARQGMEPVYASRAPKRQRKNKDVPAYDAPVEEHTRRSMARHNPLNRRTLKKAAKRARKAASKADGGANAVMEIDDGLQFTFMADTHGVVSM